MLRSRWLYVFLAVVLTTVAGLTYRAAAATNALADHSYDAVEAARLNRSITADHSYDAVEANRLNRSQAADQSYDAVEASRLSRSQAADHSYDAVEAVRADRSAQQAPLEDVVSRMARLNYLQHIK